MNHARIGCITLAALALVLGFFSQRSPVAAAGMSVDRLVDDQDKTRLQALEELVKQQRERLEALEMHIKKLTDLGNSLQSGATALQSAVELSRSSGFEAAGANSMAKTQLLDGLIAFSKAVKPKAPQNR